VYLCNEVKAEDMKSVFLTLLMFLFVSCQNDDSMIKELDCIKTIGDTNTVEAFKRLDSITPYIASNSQYVRMKYDLLIVRISDKAVIMPKSDSLIKRVLPYFLKNGSKREQQEAYYYAGSVYRDLKDYPRSLAYFLKAKELCVEDYDTLMLRNTYSNLTFVYFGTQDFRNALAMAKKNYALSKKLGMLDPIDLNQLGISLVEATKGDSRGNEKAGIIFEKSYRLLKARWNETKESERLYQTSMLLQYFCYTYRLKLAEECYNLLSKEFPEWPVTDVQKFTLALFYIVQNKLTDAASLLENLRNESADIECRYDCTKYLSLVYSAMRNTEKAAFYGDMFREISDTVDFGKRQILTATVNNQYKYFKEKDAEMRLIRESEQWRNRVALVTCAFLFILLLVALLHYRKKNALLKQLVEKETDLKQVKEETRKKEVLMAQQEENIAFLNSNLEKLKETKNGLDEELDCKSEEIASLQESLKDMANEKTALEEETRKVKAQLERLSEDTEKKKKLFAGFMQTYLLSESKIKNKEFNEKLQYLFNHGKPMPEAYWKTLFAIVNEQNPNFPEEVKKHVQPFIEEKVRYCYLMKYGLKSTQIMYIMNTKSSTHYRRMEELSWVWLS
jgi:hypothetical protein